MADASAIVAKAFADGGPRLGLGTGDLFTDGRSGDAKRLIETAFDAGFRYFDTARLYGDGQAEYAVGEALQRHRDKVVIASKAGIIPWSMRTGRRIAAKIARPLGSAALKAVGPIEARHHAFSAKDITRSVETSLGALRTDYLDVLLMHACSLADTQNPEALEAFARLQRDGKIRAWGIAGHHRETMEILADGKLKPEIVQAPADAVDQQLKSYAQAGGLMVTHSLIKPVLDALRNADAENLGHFRAATGVDPRDSDRLVALLIAYALAANPKGVVLVSTLKPERLARMHKGSAEPAAIAALDNALSEMRRKA